MERSVNQNFIIVIALLKCDIRKGNIFKTFRTVDISRIFIYRYTILEAGYVRPPSVTYISIKEFSEFRKDKNL